MNKRLATLVLFSTIAAGSSFRSAVAQNTPEDLSTVSLESLTQMRVRVSSFARKDEDLWQTPAAVFVISRDDIEHSAATNIPELLRMVPGVQVAQINAQTWAVSARGFNSAFANKLLVLVDGRTVYSEIYSGSHWDQSDVPLEDVERIEVIRGPGAAVWGTNAANGVINIITRRARTVVGFDGSSAIGRIQDTVKLQYGGSHGDQLQYRAFANFIDRRPLENSDGTHTFDGEKSLRFGGRAEWQNGLTDRITTTGDIYKGHFRQELLPLIERSVPDDRGAIGGGYLMSRWEHKSEGHDTALQLYYDDTSRHELAASAQTQTFDTEFQGHLPSAKSTDLVWGGGFRLTDDRINAAVPLTTKPQYLNYLVNVFAQDEIPVIPHRLVFTLGSKLQDGTLAGFQIQPSVRMLWTPSDSQSLWLSASRAAVAPAIQDKYIIIPVNLGIVEGLPLEGEVMGSTGYKPETIAAYEAGYRRTLPVHLTIDLAYFFNFTGRLDALSVQTPQFIVQPTPHLATTLTYINGYHARSTGAEGAVAWDPVSALAVKLSYAWAQARVEQTALGLVNPVDSWDTPRNTVALSTTWKMAQRWSLNGFVYHVDALPVSPQVNGFTRVDLHLSHKLAHSLELDAGGTNLLTPRHLEFGDGTFASSSFVPRSLFLRAEWRF